MLRHKFAGLNYRFLIDFPLHFNSFTIDLKLLEMGSGGGVHIFGVE